MIRAVRREDSGFTLIELVLVLVLMGIVSVPLANFFLAYFKNTTQTQSRLADSHDLQITTAYLSQDVANFGVRTYSGSSDTSGTKQQSLWTAAPAGSYCGSALVATASNFVMLINGDSWTSAGAATTDSVLYYTSAGALHRASCKDNGAPTSNTLVHNLSSAAVSCDVTCTNNGQTAATQWPSEIMLTLTISSGAADTARLSNFQVIGQRRQS